MLSDRPAELVAATSPGHAAGQEAAAMPNRASWVGVVVLLDYLAAFLTFAAAGGYLILKALNDQQSALMRVIELTARWFYYLGIHEMPGLPQDYRTLNTFADPFLANAYMITMAAPPPARVGWIHGPGRRARRIPAVGPASASRHRGAGHPDPRRVCVRCPGIARTRNALMAIAAFAVVPAAMLAILMTPRVAALFAQVPRRGRPRPSSPPGPGHPPIQLHPHPDPGALRARMPGERARRLRPRRPRHSPGADARSITLATRRLHQSDHADLLPT